MTCDFIQLANPGIQELKAYQAGNSVEAIMREYSLDKVVKLASNENPLGASPKALQAASNALTQSHLYPDSTGYRLRQAIADLYGIDAKLVTLGNGSDSLIRALNIAFISAQDEVLVSQYCFAPFIGIPKSLGASVKIIPAKNWGADLSAISAAITNKTKLICLANPNNPTGTWFEHEAFETFLSTIPEQVIVLLDEAYYEFIADKNHPRGIELQHRFPNLVITRTFSKAYGLAGLRIGYLIANPDITDILNRIRLPFNVTVPSVEAAIAALADQAHVEKTIKTNEMNLNALFDGLIKLNLTPIASVTNFICVDMHQPAQPLYEKLLEKGFIVRPLAAYQLLNHLRISVGTATENTEFLAVLATLL